MPEEFVESVRHLSRTREQLRQDLMRCRHRVSKLLLQHGRVYPEPTTWNQRHRSWLQRQQFEHEPTEIALCDLLAGVDGTVARKAALDDQLLRLAQDERLWPTVSRLRAFRGIDTITALCLHLELGGDWQRFSSPRKLFSWLGLTPTLEQSGESALHYARQPRIGATLCNRQLGQPAHVLQISWRAQHRTYRLHQRLRERGKPFNVATVAVARELSGFLWAAACAP